MLSASPGIKKIIYTNEKDEKILFSNKPFFLARDYLDFVWAGGRGVSCKIATHNFAF